MLVLSRKKDERIIITMGDQTIEVSVLKIDGGNVRLGIKAPQSVAIHREEVWKRQAEFSEDREKIFTPGS